MEKAELNFQYLDLSAMLLSGLAIGFERQRIADSGAFMPEKILISMIITSASFLLPVLLFSRSRNRWKVPAWIVMGLVGAALCSFALHVVYFLVSNRQYAEGRSFPEYVWWLLPDLTVSFFMAFGLYGVVSLLILGVIRLLAVGVVSLRGA